MIIIIAHSFRRSFSLWLRDPARIPFNLISWLSFFCHYVRFFYFYFVALSLYTLIDDLCMICGWCCRAALPIIIIIIDKATVAMLRSRSTHQIILIITIITHFIIMTIIILHGDCCCRCLMEKLWPMSLLLCVYNNKLSHIICVYVGPLDCDMCLCVCVACGIYNSYCILHTILAYNNNIYIFSIYNIYT